MSSALYALGRWAYPSARAGAGALARRARAAVRRGRAPGRGDRQHLQHSRHGIAGRARCPRAYLPAGERHVGPAHRRRPRRRRRDRCRLRGGRRGRDHGHRADPAGDGRELAVRRRRPRRTSAPTASAALVPIQLSVGTTSVLPSTSDALQEAGRTLEAALPDGSAGRGRRPAVLAELDGHQHHRAARHRDRLLRAARHLRVVRRRGPAAHHGAARRRRLAGDRVHRHAVPHDHLDDAAARAHARARRRHRLRAVHHLPAPGPAEARHRPRGVRRPRGRDRRARPSCSPR